MWEGVWKSWRNVDQGQRSVRKALVHVSGLSKSKADEAENTEMNGYILNPSNSWRVISEGANRRHSGSPGPRWPHWSCGSRTGPGQPHGEGSRKAARALQALARCSSLVWGPHSCAQLVSAVLGSGDVWTLYQAPRRAHSASHRAHGLPGSTGESHSHPLHR